jgi:hypothetical protein
MMRLFAATIFFSCVCFNLLAQQSEIGFGLGTLNYTGDLVRHYNFKFSQPAGTICRNSERFRKTN